MWEIMEKNMGETMGHCGAEMENVWGKWSFSGR